MPTRAITIASAAAHGPTVSVDGTWQLALTGSVALLRPRSARGGGRDCIGEEYRRGVTLTDGSDGTAGAYEFAGRAKGLSRPSDERIGPVGGASLGVRVALPARPGRVPERTRALPCLDHLRLCSKRSFERSA